MTEETCGCCGILIKEGPVFNQRFADYGWCAYDTISEELVHRANQTFEEEGMEAAQRVLIEYYKTEAPKQVEHILNASPSFAMREGMFALEHIEKELVYGTDIEPSNFADTLEAEMLKDDKYWRKHYQGTELVNDYTRKKGFFTAATTVDPWDCLVGCTEGLSKLKFQFNQNRLKTNTEPIYIPYRNGILHGRDINYGNEYVSCKCIALMFAIADWMVRRSAREELEREELQKEELREAGPGQGNRAEKGKDGRTCPL